MDKGHAPPTTFLQRLRGLVLGAVDEWFSDRASSMGAALAFYTLFSLAPVLIIVLAIAGAIFGDDAARGAIFQELNGLVGPSGAEAIQLLLANARNQKAGLIATLAALGLLAVGATTVFGELKDSLDDIWDVPRSHQSGILAFIRTRLLSFSMILVLAFLLLVSLTINAALGVVEKYLGGFWSDATYILLPVSSAISFFVIAALFAAIYKLLPQVRLPWRDVWVGAFVTAGLFIIGKKVIGVYLGNSNFITSFGAASSIIALLLWVYYSAQIFFLGAEITRQYSLWFGSRRHLAPDAAGQSHNSS
ncbi:MAG TPA: YihY/virulence factor BrkB family protein [Noviherbaspirillum sp.]|uniref:YihY/virulence factor BrkB family protein n=1 Tax=Noviherbaspirillum sp. TaxID=1926288 RepID=UPI002D3242DD|nr:YihY/virulence factor BrkB family protein [Noviherbaspirillum sp.]HYD94074.1 YihY/virulence factor BrkB family protein [Noviherbaspirillum sp.]